MIRSSWLLWTAFGIIAISGCLKDGGGTIPENKIQQLTITQTFSNGFEVDRPVLIHQPPNLNTASSYPIVFAFHGGGQKNNIWVQALKPLIDSGAFVGVYPQGYLDSWNLGQEASKLDDVAFVDDILQKIAGLNYLDFNRVYAIGYSNGAGLVNKLALETSHFDAIAPCGGQLFSSQTPDSQFKPLSVYQISGKQDTIIPFAGGFSKTSKHTYQGAKESGASWANALACGSQSQIFTVRTDTIQVLGNCNYDLEVRLHHIEGAGHDLMRSSDSLFYHRIWSFFQRF